jgi:hypothetical protein
MRRLRNVLAARLVSLIIFGVTTPAVAQIYPVCLAGGPDKIRGGAISPILDNARRPRPAGWVIA